MNTSPERDNRGVLQRLERPVLLWLSARTPGWVTPDQYTALGAMGAGVACIGYGLAALDRAWLVLASAGLIIHWFGDSLDGSLARYRGAERPKYGYFLDNALDLVALLLVTIGVGISGLVRWDLCFLALSATLMMASLTFIRAAISGKHTLTYGGVGLTEMRLGGIAFNGLVMVVAPRDFSMFNLTYPNLLSLLWSASTLAMFGLATMSHLHEVAAEDPPRGRSR